MLIKLKIFRFDPSKDKEPYYQTYEVEADPMDRLLDCLNRIRWEQDPTLSYRWSCGHGICGSDGMRMRMKELLSWIKRTGHGVVRPCGNVRRSVPKRFLSPRRSVRLNGVSTKRSTSKKLSNPLLPSCQTVRFSILSLAFACQ